MGIDRILFAVDWPFVANAPGVEWLERSAVGRGQGKIVSGNAKRLLKM